jgi:hypothetical protein
MSNRLLRALVIAGAVVVLGAASLALKVRQDLQSARQELHSAVAANEFLRKTLGDMSRAIAAKDRQIDLLERGSCEGGQKMGPGKALQGATPRPGVAGDNERRAGGQVEAKKPGEQ